MDLAERSLPEKYPIGKSLTVKSIVLRNEIVSMVYKAKTGHIGGDLSVCDILNVLYNHVMDITPENFHSENRDHFILSKGHCVEALYAVLCEKGFFPRADSETVSAFGSKYIGHPSNQVNGIEMNSGSLGHGLSVGVGMALAQKANETRHRIYVVMGDGELAEGSVWEGAMAGGHYQLNNLCAVIDRNGLQISGTTEAVMAQESLKTRWAAFGWNVIIAENGNDCAQLAEAFEKAKVCKDKPSVILAQTVKGYGISFMENKAEWHHRVPTEAEYQQALAELAERQAAYE